MTPTNPFEDLSPAALHERRSEKWAVYPPDVLPAFVAETDFPVPPPVRDALQKALDRGDTGYAWPGAVAPAFAAFVHRRFQWELPPERVFEVPDVMAGVTQALHVLTQPGAGIVINPPVYAPFFETIRSCGRGCVEVPLVRASDGRWDLDFHGLERAFAAGAQAYLVCSPHNPVGRVWSGEQIERIAQLAAYYNVAVIADEIHAPLTMPGVNFTPFLGVPGRRRSVALMSASKAWNIAALKCGVLAACADVAADVSARLRSIPTEIEARVGHWGALASVAAFQHGDAWLDEERAHLQQNSILLQSLLSEQIPQARFVPPEATYLAWIDCSALGIEGDPANYFLERGRVALERGSKFGTGGEQYVRLNFGTSSAILREIVVRMSTAFVGRHKV